MYLFPLASSTLYLHSKLVSLPKNYWLDLSLTNFLLSPIHELGDQELYVSSHYTWVCTARDQVMQAT